MRVRAGHVAKPELQLVLVRQMRLTAHGIHGTHTIACLQERYNRYLVDWHGSEIKAAFARTRNNEQ